MAKILIVEDDLDALKLLSKRILNEGHEALAAKDAYQGTVLLRKENPDLVLLDLMMPAGGGIQVLKNMRQSTQIGHTPVIVLTAVGDENYKRMVMDMHIEAYINKPYDPEKLMKVVNDILVR
jgi:DNA-binding response OmpR family regulator